MHIYFLFLFQQLFGTEFCIRAHWLLAQCTRVNDATRHLRIADTLADQWTPTQCIIVPQQTRSIIDRSTIADQLNRIERSNRLASLQALLDVGAYSEVSK